MKSITQVVQNLLKPYIDAKDKANAELIAPVEVSPAEAAHTAGTQLVYDGILYDVTANIAIGDALATSGAGANISLSDDISTKLRNIKADYIGLYGETAISTATDLNTMQTVGNYYKASTSFAVTNAPAGIAEDVQAKFRLTVEKVLDSADSIVLQVLTATTGESYYRIYGGVSWGDWEEITTASAMADAIAAQAAKIFAVMGKNGAKNLLPISLNYLKSINTHGTWNGNAYTVDGVTYTVNTDSHGNIANITTSGTASTNSAMNIYGTDASYGENNFSGMILNGCPSGGGTASTDYRIVAFVGNSQDGTSHSTINDTGDGVTLTNASYLRIYLRVPNGYSSSLVFKPMIRLASDTDNTYQPYAKTNQELTAENQTLTNRVDRIDTMLDGLVYGFQINDSESDPAAAVTYLEDAVGMTPAKMDFTNNKFDYGDWENAFFMPRPCMLKSDGTVDYYLNPNDYTKKEDGTASDIADTTYDGNAMMEWGRNGHKIWLKILPTNSGAGAKVYISNHKADSKFFDYPFHNCKGESVDHFYTPIYNGSVISSKMRSLSGQTVSKTLTGTAEITAAKANNPSTDELWNIECVADRFLINMLLILMGKSLNTQAVFGQGLNSGGNETINDGFTTGVHNAKGLFYGTNDGTASVYTNAVKIFGMENYYGFQWRRTNGLILANGATKYKLTYGTEDGSSATGYNTDGTDYKDAGITPSGTSGGYISKAKFTEDGMFSDTMSGSISTYYCDGTWFNTSGSRFALFGGGSSGGGKVGAFCLVLSSAVSTADWIVGAALSCKPLA